MTRTSHPEAVEAVNQDHDHAETVLLGGSAHPLGALDLSDLAVHPDAAPSPTVNLGAAMFSCAACTVSVSLCC